MADRADAMHELLRRSHETGREPWGSMYADGHGEHWSGTVDFARVRALVRAFPHVVVHVVVH